MQRVSMIEHPMNGESCEMDRLSTALQERTLAGKRRSIDTRILASQGDREATPLIQPRRVDADR